MQIRTVTPADESAWSDLYRGYRAFYALAADDTRARQVYDRSAVATPWVTYDMRPALD